MHCGPGNLPRTPQKPCSCLYSNICSCSVVKIRKLHKSIKACKAFMSIVGNTLKADWSVPSKSTKIPNKCKGVESWRRPIFPRRTGKRTPCALDFVACCAHLVAVRHYCARAKMKLMFLLMRHFNFASKNRTSMISLNFNWGNLSLLWFLPPSIH